MITAETHTKKYANGGTGQWTYLASFEPENPTKKIWVREDEVLAEVESTLEGMSIKNEAILSNIMQYIRKSHEEKKLYHREQTANLKKEHTQIEDKIDTLVDLLMDKVIDKEEFEVKKKRLKDRQYQIDDLIRSFDEADDAFNEKLLNLVELAARAISHFKGSDIPRKMELLNFIFQNLSLRGKKLEYTMRSPFKEFAEASKIEEWSGREDSNLRPSGPKPDALPGCATPRNKPNQCFALKERGCHHTHHNLFVNHK
jgi:site-specific DNA recombinase